MDKNCAVTNPDSKVGNEIGHTSPDVTSSPDTSTSASTYAEYADAPTRDAALSVVDQVDISNQPQGSISFLKDFFELDISVSQHSDMEPIQSPEIIEAFEALMTTMLTIEIVDMVTRLHSYAPIQKYDGMVATLRSSKNRIELHKNANLVFGQIPENIQLPDGIIYKKLMSLLTCDEPSSKNKFLEILKSTTDWIRHFCKQKTLGGKALGKYDRKPENLLKPADFSEFIQTLSMYIKYRFEIFSHETSEHNFAVALKAISGSLHREHTYYCHGVVAKNESETEGSNPESSSGAIVLRYLQGHDIEAEFAEAFAIIGQIKKEMERRFSNVHCSDDQKTLAFSIFDEFASKNPILSLKEIRENFRSFLDRSYFIGNLMINCINMSLGALVNHSGDGRIFGTLGRLSEITPAAIREKHNPLGHSILETITGKINNPADHQMPLTQRNLYFNPDIYRVYPQAPPSSTRPNVLLLEAANGCSHNGCTFCGLYKDEQFWITSVDEFREHVARIKEFTTPEDMKKWNRIFLTGGNALSIPTDRLLQMLDIMRKELTGMRNRIECYANTQDILRKGLKDMRRLNNEGDLNFVYWGIESGSDEVLSFVNKKQRAEDVIKAGEILKASYIETSVTVMPGLGGAKHADDHIQKTAEVLGRVRPRFVTLMGTRIAPGSQYEADLEHDDGNHALNPHDLAQHTRAMIDAIHRRLSRGRHPVKIAAYSPDITPTADNAETLVRYVH